MSKDTKPKKRRARTAVLYADEKLQVPIIPSAIKFAKSTPDNWVPQKSIRPQDGDDE